MPIPGPASPARFRGLADRRRRSRDRGRLAPDQIAESEVLADLERRENWNHPTRDHQRPGRPPAPARPRRPVRPLGLLGLVSLIVSPWTGVVLILVAGTGVA
jgi:hypothetical protein